MHVGMVPCMPLYYRAGIQEVLATCNKFIYIPSLNITLATKSYNEKNDVEKK